MYLLTLCGSLCSRSLRKLAELDFLDGPVLLPAFEQQQEDGSSVTYSLSCTRFFSPPCVPLSLHYGPAPAVDNHGIIPVCTLPHATLSRIRMWTCVHLLAGDRRSWWRASEDGSVYDGVDATLEYVISYMQENGPFDGVLGFSQGFGVIPPCSCGYSVWSLAWCHEEGFVSCHPPSCVVFLDSRTGPPSSSCCVDYARKCCEVARPRIVRTILC